MKVFMTGATGFTGYPILRRLVDAGYPITALYRETKIPGPNVNWIKGDLHDFTPEMKKAIADSNILIHHAATLKSSSSPDDIDEIENININATREILNYANCALLNKIIFTSSLSVIKKPLPAIITEESETNPILPYAVSKLKGEQMVMNFAMSNNIGYNILRLSSPVGTHLDQMHNNVLKTWIMNSLKGATIRVHGDGKRTQDFVSVHDIADAYHGCIIHTDINGLFNIASGTALSMTTLAEIITQHFGNDFEYWGDDANNNDQWNVSIQKAQRLLHFNPKYNSVSAVKLLLNSIAS